MRKIIKKINSIVMSYAIPLETTLQPTEKALHIVT